MTKEEIKEKFVSTYKEYVKRSGAALLLNHLLSHGFFEAPASTRYHGCYEGGLAEHSLHVMKRLMEKEEVTSRYSKETIVIVGLLHDVCKMDNYKKKKDRYEYAPDFPAGHGEKSVMMIQKHIPLTDEESLAIRWHMGAWDDAVRGGCRDINNAYRKSKLAVWLHLADMEATYIDEAEE